MPIIQWEIYPHLISDYCLGCLSTGDLEKKYGINRTAIKEFLSKHGILRNRSDAAKVRYRNGNTNIENLIKAAKTTNRFNPSKAQHKEDHWKWLPQGCVVSTHNGKYQKIKINSKWIYLHIYIAETVLGRKLQNDEVVHHIDLDCGNNSPDNLLVMKRKEHMALHNAMASELIRELLQLGLVGFSREQRRYEINVSD